jgi:hypothetical protein
MPSLSVFHLERSMRCAVLAVTMFAVPATVTAQARMTAAQQIALAVLPLPASFRAGATVLGYDAAGKLAVLRRGAGNMTCLMSDPKLSTFDPACYQNSLEPFMARGRALRSQGVQGAKVDSARFAEVKAGRLKVPAQAATLWALDGPMSGVNIAAGTISAAIKPRVAVYMPFATAASTGLPDQPIANGPWLMDAGTPKAHLMFTQSM